MLVTDRRRGDGLATCVCVVAHRRCGSRSPPWSGSAGEPGCCDAAVCV